MGIIDTAWEKRVCENKGNDFGISELSKGLYEMAKSAYAVGWLDSESARQEKADGAKTPTNTQSKPFICPICSEMTKGYCPVCRKQIG